MALVAEGDGSIEKMGKLLKSKKGQIFDQLSKMAIGVAVVALVIVVTFVILAQLGDQAADSDSASSSFALCNSSACNTTRTVQSEMDQIPDWLGIAIITGIGIVILGMVQGFRKVGGR